MDRLCNPFPMNEDGAHYMTNGKFAMPAPSPQGSKKPSRKTLTVIAVVSCVLVAAVATVAFWLGRSDRFTPPYQEDLSLSVGSPREAVLSRLELQESDLTQVSPGVYKLTDGCQYAGVALDVLLHFDSHDGLLYAYEYTAEYEAAAKNAAKDVSKVANTLDSYINGTHLHKEGQCLKLRRSALSEEFSGAEVYSLYKSWDLTPIEGGSPTPVSDYLEHLETSDYWEGRVAGYLTIPAAYYQDVTMEYDPQTQTVSIRVLYSAEARRTGLLDR